MTPEEKFEKALGEIRDEAIDDAVAEGAAARVWEKLEQHAPLRTCADFQALIPAFRAGRLTEARRLLFVDHTHECVACRKATEAAAGKERVVAMPARRAAWVSRPAFRWAVAAMVAVGAGFSAWQAYQHYGPVPAGSTTVQAVDGRLYRVADGQNVATGQQIASGTEFRTAKGSGAVVKLRDGSTVEMREGSGFRVSERGRDLTIHLESGSIIVQAAKRRLGHLYVATRDFRVAVTGTVFNVTTAVKGSRVSVIEGQVQVAQAGKTTVLRPGEQYASDPSMAPVPVRDEIAWSRNLDQHLALMKEFSGLQKEIEKIRMPELRYSSKLLPLLPPQTAVYVAIPNLGRALSEAQQIFHQRVQDSPVLREWWDKQHANTEGPRFDDIMTRVRALSDYLGDEVVVAFQQMPGGKAGTPVFVAELKRPGFREFVESEMQKLPQKGGGIRIMDSGAAPAEKNDLQMLIRPDVVVMSPDAAAIGQMTGGLTASPFGARLAESYKSGVGLLIAADLEKLTSNMKLPEGRPESSLFQNVKYLVLEQKETGGKTDTHATLTFSGERAGIASWLAKPVPMRAMDFLSPETTGAVALALKSPAAILENLLSLSQGSKVDFAAAEARLGVNVRDDIVGQLGSEVVVAWDGPVLPVPSWKLVIEVYDAARLQAALAKIIEMATSAAAFYGNAQSAPKLSQETANGRTYFTLTMPQGKGPFTEAHWVFVDGYLLAAPNRQLLDRAIQYRATGYTLPRSETFTALLPQDRFTGFSGMVYQNAGQTLAPITGMLGDANLTPEQKEAVRGITKELKPLLVTFYGEDDRITLASTGTLFSLKSVLGMQSPMHALGMLRAPGKRTAKQ